MLQPVECRLFIHSFHIYSTGARVPEEEEEKVHGIYMLCTIILILLLMLLLAALELSSHETRLLTEEAFQRSRGRKSGFLIALATVTEDPVI